MSKDVTIIISAKDLATGTIIKVGDSLATASQKAKAFGETLSSAGRGLTTYVTAPIIAAGAAIYKFGTDAIESENLFRVSMDEMADAAHEWSEQLRESFGFNSYALREYIGTFNVMLDSMGMGKQAAFDMSKGLTQLAYDMSSFYNIDIGDAFEKLQSGITGIGRPLKSLGIIIDESIIQAYAYKTGIAEVGAQLTEQQKVLARYGSIMEQTIKAQGDFARTMESPANKLKLLKEQLQQAVAELGTKMMPIIAQLLDAMIPIVQAIGQLAERFAALSPGMQEFIVKAVLAVAALGPLLSVFSGITRTVTSVIDAFRAVKDALVGISVGGSAALATIGLLVADLLIWVDVMKQLKAETGYWGVNWELTILNAKRAWFNFLVFLNETALKLLPKGRWELAGITIANWDGLTSGLQANLDGLKRKLDELDELEADIGRRVLEIDKMKAAKMMPERPTVPGFDYGNWQAELQGYLDGVAGFSTATTDTLTQDLQRLTDQRMRLMLSSHDYELWALEEEARAFREKYKDNAEVLAEFELYYQAKQNAIHKSVNDAIAQERKNLTDQFMRLTLSETDYQLWALEQQRQHYEETFKDNKDVLDDFYRYYKAVLAKIEKDKLSESMALREDYINRALQLSMPSNVYRRFALQAERVKFMTTHTDPDERADYDRYYNAQIAAWDKEEADAREKIRKDLADKTMRLTLSELDYQKWALEQERIEFEKAHAGQTELLDAFAEYYKARMAELVEANPFTEVWEKTKKMLAEIKAAWQQGTSMAQRMQAAQWLAGSIGQSALQGMPILNNALQGAQAGAALGLEGMIAGALAALIPASETFTRLLNIINPILQAVADTVGLILEPLIPLYQVISMTLVPVLQTLGTIISSVLMPMMRAMFPVYKILGHVIIGVAQGIGAVWNLLVGLIDAIPFVDMSEYYIDMEALSDAQKALADLTWDAALAMDDTADAAREVSEALRNVPSGFKIALARFDAAQGISGGRGTAGPAPSFGARPKPDEMHLHIHMEHATIYGVDDLDRRISQSVDKATAKAGLGRGGLRPAAGVV